MRWLVENGTSLEDRSEGLYVRGLRNDCPQSIIGHGMRSDAVIAERCWYAEPASGTCMAHGPVFGPIGVFLGETVGDLTQ